MKKYLILTAAFFVAVGKVMRFTALTPATKGIGRLMVGSWLFAMLTSTNAMFWAVQAGTWSWGWYVLYGLLILGDAVMLRFAVLGYYARKLADQDKERALAEYVEFERIVDPLKSPK
jgi:hypothetical protein